MSKSPHIEDLDEDEQKLCEIHRHPFGLISVYVGVVARLIILVVIMYLVLPSIFTDNSHDQLDTMVLVGAVLLGILGGIGLVLFTFIYNRNFLIVTNRDVTEVLQKSLLGRQVSELSLANVEDVTAIKQGVFPTMFNFGLLRIETAGEMENFVFALCPDPNYYGKVILDARRQFVANNPDRREQRAAKPDEVQQVTSL